eukprot:CAMPEP_0194537880 /NCGR_PEP_ID=MMETSP0253-20130528/77285_1 /TAXON_ID=2966 /ORGANISM="Noctiluca scintillans" /LENGTH=68 /DNA_ID=CAMNT_0039383935 /DNA_START=137 /DNA_END=340 /DNA_ORIENTATION=+
MHSVDDKKRCSGPSNFSVPSFFMCFLQNTWSMIKQMPRTSPTGKNTGVCFFFGVQISAATEKLLPDID